MEVILASEERFELGILNRSKRIDVDIGETNDFEIVISREDSKKQELDFGKTIFVPNTEFGGILEERQTTTMSNYVYWRGYTWRGLLDQIIIEPPQGESYLTVSGEANKVIDNLLQRYDLGALFTTSDADSKIIIRNHKIPRYYTALKVIAEMLGQYDAKVSIFTTQGADGERFQICIGATPIVDYSEELEYSDDDRNVSMTITDYRRGITHLICLGQGELVEREVVHLYLQLDGTISKRRYYTGLKERTAVYENTAAQGMADLEASGRERFKELLSYKEQELKVSNVDLNIGDIVAGRDYETNSYLSKPIIQKILSIDGLKTTIQYKVKGEN